MTRWRAAAIAIGALLVAPRARAIEPGDTDFEAGQQVSVLLDGKVSRNLSYALFRTRPVIARNDETGSTWELRLGARAFYDFAPGEDEVSIRDLAIVRRTDHVTATVGFQEIPWGETLGFPVADIVNPRDLRDPLFLDVDWVRLPVLAANVQYTAGPLRVQGIFTPIARSPQLPEPSSPFVPALPPGVLLAGAPTYAVDDFPRDAEGGGRVSYLVAGWDLSAFFLTHYNRVPVYELVIPTVGFPVLAPVFDRVSTPGVSLTKPFGDDLVVRLDSVLNLGEPQQSPGLARPDTVIESQSVLEADWTLEGDWAITVQGEYDRQGELNRAWLSGRIAKDLFDHRLSLSAFAFGGVNNADAWVEPMVTWSFLDVFSASLRGDFVWGSGSREGELGYLDGKHRVMGIVRVKL